MKRLVTFALGAVLAAGCNCGGPSTPKDLYHDLVDALCNWETRCGAIGKSEGSQCKSDGDTYVDKYLLASSGYDLDAAIAAKRIEINSGQANKCLDVYRNLSCSGFNSLLASSACADVYNGLVKLGGACQSSYECSDGFCQLTTTGNACAGVCAAFAAENASCASGARCNGKVDFCDSSSICRARGGSGAACTSTLFSTDCKEGLVCNGGACSAPPTAGQSCVSGYCAQGLHCTSPGGSSGVCATQVGSGQACSDPYACPDGQRCAGLTTTGGTGKCTDLLDIGGTCDPTDVLCPADAPCDATAKRCTLSTMGKEGSSCTGTGTCYSSSGIFSPPLYCDGTSGKCTEKLVPNQACTPPASGQDEPCITTCDATAHTCAAATASCF